MSADLADTLVVLLYFFVIVFSLLALVFVEWLHRSRISPVADERTPATGTEQNAPSAVPSLCGASDARSVQWALNHPTRQAVIEFLMEQNAPVSTREIAAAIGPGHAKATLNSSLVQLEEASFTTVYFGGKTGRAKYHRINDRPFEAHAEYMAAMTRRSTIRRGKQSG